MSKKAGPVVDTTAVVVTTPQSMTWKDTKSMGEVLAESGMFTDVKTQAQAIVKIMAGRELGIGPIVALTKIFVVQGRVALSAEVMAGLIKRSQDYDYIIKAHTERICTLHFMYKGKFIGESTFKLEDAQRAGVSYGVNWKKYPRNMLFARALSNGARWYCPHLIAGTYTPDEMGLRVDNQGEVIDIDAEVSKPVEISTIGRLVKLAKKYHMRKTVKKFMASTLGKDKFKDLTEDEAVRLINIVKKKGREKHERNIKRAATAAERVEEEQGEDA